MLALFSRLPLKEMANQGFIAFAVMVWIYVGVRLGVGSIEEILLESLFALTACGLVQLAMLKWRPVIGLAILLHGAYDAAIGPHTGVAQWYPPLCAGFDLVVGAGLFLILRREQSN